MQDRQTRKRFLDAVGTVLPLLESKAVAAAWLAPSALAEWPVGGLAGHLVRDVAAVTRYLDAAEPSAEEPLTSALDYYTEVLPTVFSLDDPVHRAIRERANELAAAGPTVVAGRLRDLLSTLGSRLGHEPDRRRVRVVNDLVMELDDYLLTRLVEIAVHSDDLAVSVDQSPPPFSPAVINSAIETLLGTARHRHGDLAVLRALTRRERDPLQALRVF